MTQLPHSPMELNDPRVIIVAFSTIKLGLSPLHSPKCRSLGNLRERFQQTDTITLVEIDRQRPNRAADYSGDCGVDRLRTPFAILDRAEAVGVVRLHSEFDAVGCRGIGG